MKSSHLLVGVLASAFFLAVVTGLALYFSAGPKLFKIHPVSERFEVHYKKFAPFSIGTSTANIEVFGELNGQARLYIGATSEELGNTNGFLIGSGAVRLEEQFFEWWSNECYIVYIPIDVSEGHLDVQIAIN